MWPLFAEAMDKMPSLASVWLFAVIAGAVAFASARFLPFGWLIGVLLIGFQYESDWFVGPVAEAGDESAGAWLE